MQVERTGSVMRSLNITLLLPRLLWWPDTFYYFKHVETTVLSKQGPTCGCDHYRFTSAYSRRLCVSGAIISEPPIVQTQIRCRNITVGHNTKRVMVGKCGLILLGIQCSKCVVKSDNSVIYGFLVFWYWWWPPLSKQLFKRKLPFMSALIFDAFASLGTFKLIYFFFMFML